MSGYQAARVNMIESQLRPNKITDERLLAAFLSTRRELFVPVALRGIAYVDEDIPLGSGRFLMEPMVAARLIQAAFVQPMDSVLIVGAATGYEAALFSRLAKSVTALEEDETLSRAARDGMVEHMIASVAMVEGGLAQGYRNRAPYDVIFFPGAIAELPAEIGQQLAEGGRLVAVFRSGSGSGRATLVTRNGGVLARRVLFDAGTPMIPAFRPKPAFVF